MNLDLCKLFKGCVAISYFFFFFVKGKKIKSCPLHEEIEIHLCYSRLIMIIFCQVG